MTAILFANTARSTLAAAISPSATSLTVAPGTGYLFPTPAAGQYFTLTLYDPAAPVVTEIVKVTAIAADTMTIARAQEGTAALGWAAGNVAANLVTAASLAAMALLAEIAPYIYIVRTAAQSLAVHRVIKTVGATGGDYASADNAGDANLVLGLSVAATANAQPVTIQFAGEVTDSGWNWTPGPVWLGLNGALTQDPTGLLVIRQIGTAITATRIVINIQPAEVLPAMSLNYVAGSPFTTSSTWAKVTTTTAATVGLSIGDTSVQSAAFDIFYTWVAHNAPPPDGTVFGFAVGQEKLLTKGIPIGDIYLRSAYSNAIASVAQA